MPILSLNKIEIFKKNKIKIRNNRAQFTYTFG